MDTSVFIWPVHILTSLYGDLVGGPERGRGFIIEHNEIVENGEVWDRLTVKIHCRTALVPRGRIDLEVLGENARGFETDCTTILAIVEALRTDYGIFPADFSYAVIAEKRGLFNAMQGALQEIVQAYFKMDEAIAGYNDSMSNFKNALSSWLNANHEGARVYTVAAVRTMTVWATNSAAVNKGKTVAANTVSTLSATRSNPPGLRRLDRTAPMPMVTCHFKL